MTHTPGPWHRNIKPATKYATIFAGRSTHVCHLATAGLTPEEVESNCDLIAAAPDLLEALQIMVRAFNSEDVDPLVAFASIERARAAIAKAEGAK